MRRQIPPLTALRAFEAAARLDSFRAAAEELNISQSAVSHQIAGLEERLGAALFRRTARRVELTEAGGLYYPFLCDAFDRISQGTELVLRAARSDDLMVQVYVTAPKFDSYLLALEAALDGQGVTLAPHFLVAEDLKSGRLVAPFDITAPQPDGWYLICMKERAQEPRIKRFTEWLQQQIEVDPNFAPGQSFRRNY